MRNNCLSLKRIFFVSTLSIVLFFNFYDGTGTSLNLPEKSILTCKLPFILEKNLSVCLDYATEEGRDSYVISSSTSEKMEWNESILKQKRIQALLFHPRHSAEYSRNVIETDTILTGTEMKRPIKNSANFGIHKTHSLSSAFRQLNTYIVDIVFLSNNSHLETILSTAEATETLKHIKYLIIKDKRDKIYDSWKKFLKVAGFHILESKNLPNANQIVIYKHGKMDLDVPIIHMDTLNHLRKDSAVQFAQSEVEHLVYEVYLIKHLPWQLNYERFVRWVLSPTITCPMSRRFGNAHDGGWDACVSNGLFDDYPCRVYSFGINNDFTFDDSISKEMNCQVKSFDPSMKDSDYERSNLVSFYKLGLEGRDFINDKGWSLLSWRSILKKFGDEENIIHFLKIDIEGAEVPAFETALKDGSLKNVRQIGFEIHGMNPKVTLRYWRLLKTLETHGFLRWKSHVNPRTITTAGDASLKINHIELYYINVNFLKP